MTSDPLNSTLPTSTGDALAGWLISWLARRLGVDPAAIDPGEALNHQGLDSLGATQLAAALSRKLERPLSSVLVWEHPTVDELMAHLTGGSVTEKRQSVASGPSARTDEAIAIVGLACRVPGASSPRELWYRLCSRWRNPCRALGGR